MAPTTAIAFVATGLALLLLATETRRGSWSAQVLSLLVFSLGILGLVGHVFGVATLYIITSTNAIALHTSGLFILLAIGMLSARAGRGFMEIATSGSAGGIMARRLLPIAVIAPIVLGWIQVVSERVRLVRSEAAVPFLVISSVVVSVGAVWWIVSALHREEIEHAALFERVPVGLFRTTPDGRILRANPAFIEILGLSNLEPATSGNIGDFYVNADDRRTWMSQIDQKGITRNYQVQMRQRDGKLIWVEENSRAIVDATGRVKYYEGSLEDITARKEAVEELQVARERLSHLLTSSPAVIYSRSIAAGNALTFVSENVRAQFGYEAREFIEASGFWADRVHPDDAPRVRNDLSLLLRRGTYASEYRFRHTSGAYLWVFDQAHLVRDQSGNPVEAVGHWIDVAVRREAEDALRAREHFLATLNEITRAALESLDFEGMLQTVADRLREVFGADNCYITLWDDVHQRTLAGATSGPAPEGYPLIPPESGEETITSAVLQAGHALVIEDVARTPHLSPRLAAQLAEYARALGQPHQSVLGVPLVAMGLKLGAVLLSFNAPRRFTHEEIAQGEQAAGQIALAVARARLLHETGRRAAELATLVGIINTTLKTTDLDERLDAILQPVMAFLRTECGGIFLRQGDGVSLRAHRGISAGLRAEILAFVERSGIDLLRTSRVLHAGSGDEDELIPNFARREGIRTWATFPLLLQAPAGGGQAEWLGTIAVGSRDASILTEDHVQAVHRMLQPMSLAVDHARAYRQATDRLMRLQALHDIDLAITSTFDLKVMLHVVITQAIAHLHVDAAAILLYNQHTQSLTYASGRGFRTGAFRLATAPSGEGYANRVVLERQTMIIRGLPTDPEGLLGPRLVVEEGFVAYCAAPMVAKGQVKGVLELYHRAPMEIDDEWLTFLDGLSAEAAIAIDSVSLFDDLQRSNAALTLAYGSTLEGWVRALDMRDRETEGHTQRVTEMTLRLAEAMGVPADELIHIRRGALLHDIGKMAIPDSILLRQGPLTDEEMTVVRRHPIFAYEVLSPILFLQRALDIPYAHHEKWDGTGYPRGLKGEQIPLTARIFAVVDVWDAMRSSRPYRDALPEEQVLAYVRDHAGTHFDPRVAEAFLTLLSTRSA